MTRRPSPRLAGIVERLWRVEEGPSPSSPETICPDGCPEVVFHLGDPMREQPRHLLVGQMHAPMTVLPTGRVAMLGARFTPAGLYRLLPVAQDRLLGHIIALDAVWNGRTRRTADAIASAGNPDREMDAFERALEQLVTDAPADRGIEMAVRRMRLRGGPLSSDSAAAACGLSRRQFERRFREQVGLSPHMFGRIVRFQEAFARLGHESGAALAARLGFVDQAHLVREVRRFSARTPTLLAEAEGLTTFFRRC
jgi:AraC-like DNA-binding protein